ncbi:unnamed protein product [Urochloa decumbens]|uniref:F-box domain-containing protein n=1 Tax=Urochloa decumbens TaxID=240449 RepID=A0ABC9A9J2_9POAL
MPPELEIGSKPLLIRFNGVDRPVLVDPFDGGFREATLELEALQGKECLDCFQGEWLLMFDGGTKECFLVSLVSLSRISLPPLLTPLENIYMCALSSPTLPDCTIMFIAERIKYGGDEEEEEERYLVYCRPGDEEWWELDDETDDMHTFVAVNAALSSSSDAYIERRGIPHPSKMRCGQNTYLVESDGDVFLLQFYTHGFYNSEVIDMDIHRLDTSGYVWEKVESIGDRTIFVSSNNCVALSSASRAGIQPGCVHLLHEHCFDGTRLYTIWLDDRTMRCSLLPAGSFDSLYWVVPSSFKKGLSENLTQWNNKIKLTSYEDMEQALAPWSSLPVEMVEELVPRISLIDYLNVRGVCKGWNLISKPIQYGKRYPRYPMLLSISSSVGVFKLFDPIVKNEYTMKNNSLVPCKDYFQMPLFTKDGWVLVIRGNKYMYAANPFTGEVVELPEIPWLGEQFDGISFSSPPNSPNCIVCSTHKERVSNQAQSNTIYVMVWRTGDKQWTKKKIEDHTEFRTAYSNPIFYHGEFYCLGTRGSLGIFNPNNMTWRVLDKPDPILVGDPMSGEQYCHLLEFRDDLIAIFRPHNKGPIDLYRLNKVQMVWIKIDRLDDEVVYVDNWNAIMMPTPRDACCNRSYLPKLGVYDEAREAYNSAFYDLRSSSYYPNYYGLTERMNSIWILPNFRGQ